MNLSIHAIAVLMLLTVVGCNASETVSAANSSICDVERAQSLVGLGKPKDAEGMLRTGATIVRQVVPGQPVTEDYRENRVTIETDPSTLLVVRATCG